MKRVQDDAHTSASHTEVYDTFELEEGDRRGGGDQRQDQKVKRTTRCSPGALLRLLACTMRGRGEPEESWPLTEKFHATPSAGCSSQLTRVRGVVRLSVFSFFINMT